MDQPRILITPRSLTQAGLDNVVELEPLRQAGCELLATPAGLLPTAEVLRNMLPGVDGWLAGVEPITAEVLAHADRLLVISRNGAGVDSVDAVAAESRGVKVVRAAGANAQGVAELALTVGLSCLRSVPWSAQALKQGDWSRSQGRELAEVRIGVVGLGAIGRRVAQMFAILGAHVFGYDPYTSVDGIENVTLEEVFSHSELVSLHAPVPAGGVALVGGKLLERLPAGSVLVNTARSALVDDDAVLAALESGRLSAYAVDAFDTEPPALTPLLCHPRVLATPHLGGYTDASVSRATAMAVDNLLTTLGIAASNPSTNW